MYKSTQNAMNMYIYVAKNAHSINTYDRIQTKDTTNACQHIRAYVKIEYKLCRHI